MPKKSPITFNTKYHTYTNAQGVRYTSQSKFMKQVIPPFDVDYWARKKANEYSYQDWVEYFMRKYHVSRKKAEKLLKDVKEFSPSWVKSVWRNLGEVACLGGTVAHDRLELIEAKKKNRVYNPIIQGKKQSLNLKKLEAGKTYLEQIVYNHKWELAGQADRNKFEKGLRLIGRDWKTFANEPTEFENYEQFGDTMLAPITHIPNNNFYKTALQLSWYCYLLEQYGAQYKALFLDWIPTTYKKRKNIKKKDIVLFRNDVTGMVRVQSGKPKPIEMPFLRDEIKLLIGMWENKLKGLA